MDPSNHFTPINSSDFLSLALHTELLLLDSPVEVYSYNSDEEYRSYSPQHQLQPQPHPNIWITMTDPHPKDHLLRAMYDDPQYQTFINADHDTDLAKMEYQGADFIRDFLIFHDIPKDQAARVNKFLHTFYMGTCSISHDFHEFADSAEPWKDGFDRWEYIGRLASVYKWISTDQLYKRFQETLSTILEFGFLVQTEHGEFVARRMKAVGRWLKAVGEIDVQNFDDAGKVNVGVIGSRYAVQQIWIVCEVFLLQRDAAKERSGITDPPRDSEVIP